MKHKSGFSLIEIMVASLVLAALAVGGSAALYRTGAMIQNQEQKRKAVDQAMERMELLKRTKYSLMQPANFNTPMYYVDDGDELFEAGELLGAKTVDNTKPFTMTTQIQRFPPPDAVSSEFIQINVAVTYDIAGQQVKLDATIIPDL